MRSARTGFHPDPRCRRSSLPARVGWPRSRPAFDVSSAAAPSTTARGAPGRRADVGIRGDRIAASATFASAAATTVVDAAGLAVAPGFINMLSWSTESLLVDGRSQGEIRQGVTTQIFGEGSSMGPLNDGDEEARRRADGRPQVRHHLDDAGRVPAGAGAARRVAERRVVHRRDDDPRARHRARRQASRRPRSSTQMRALVRQEMEAGALGIGSSLIYAPAFYASTEELIELCKVAAQYRGKYISHMRSEGNRLLEAVDELIRISREAGIPAEIYHLKAAGQANWPKMDQRHREGRGGAARAAEDHRRHVHLPGRRDRARRVDAAVGARRRLRGGVQAAARSGDAQEDRRGDPRRRPTTGRTCTSPPARPTACCWSSSRPTS